MRWNHNIHYQRLVLAQIPAGARTALDIGCGEGMLTRALGDRIPEVVGVDRDEPSIALAREQGGEYVLGDVLTHPFTPASFDLVASISTLHHMDFEAGLARMAHLLAPGGRLVIVGCARSVFPRDLPWQLAGAVTTRVLKLRHRYWEHSAPVADATMTYAQIREQAVELLPGARFRRLVLWRYLLVWTKP